MTTSRIGLSWNRARSWIALAVAISFAAPLSVSSPLSADVTDGAVSVIVRETNPATSAAEALVEDLGGTVLESISIIGGFTATVPDAALEILASSPTVVSATLDRQAADLTAGWQDATNLGEFVPNEWKGSMLHVGYQLGVNEYWRAGYTGTGVGVALIDTGVAPVEGLTGQGKIINGPDLSFESQSDEFRYLDTYGHGTHLAGIIAGRDPAAPAELTIDNAESYFLGAAPDAHLVNVKVAGHDGAVDVSQVIAAIDWVAQHKNEHNIRIINLSFGTDSTQDPLLDPLSYAVEQAWKQGLVVIVASGNDGNAAAVRNPATNPYVITVGAMDGYRLRGKDTQPIPEWSSCGTERTVDIIAPGSSIVSLRSPGSAADTDHPEARVAERFFLGSGTSQAAAAASGAAALVLQRNPEYSPDDVKDVLVDSADSFRRVSPTCQGAGKIRLHDTWWESPDGSTQTHLAATGLGWLEASRGTDHLEMDGVVLEGEQDIFGNAWDGASWSLATAQGASWSGGDWNGATWTGGSWSGGSWSGATWTGGSWSGGSWSAMAWSSNTWSGGSWSGGSWSGTSWAGGSWSGGSWSGLSWE